MYAIRSYYEITVTKDETRYKPRKTEEELKALEAEGLEFNGYDGMMAEMKKGSLVIDDLSHYEMEKLIEKYHPDRITSYNVCYTKLLRFSALVLRLVAGSIRS